MTRINVVPVEELSDQHLLAEYRELPRCIKQNINIKDAPKKYCLSTGHMKWGRTHVVYLVMRYISLYRELLVRGIKTQFFPTALLQYCVDSGIAFNTSLWNPYKVTKEDIEINRTRLVEKYRMKPNWYRWTNREKPKYMEV